MPSRRWLPAGYLAALSLLWGFVLSGSFFFVPQHLSQQTQGVTNLTVSTGWLALIICYALVGLSYQRIAKSRLTYLTVIGAVALAIFLSLAFGFSNVGLAITLLFAGSAIQIGLLTLILSNESSASLLVRNSALVGAAPIAGSTLLSMFFGFTAIFDYFLLLFAAVSICAFVLLLLSGKPAVFDKSPKSNNYQQRQFFSFGFLLSAALAIANLHLFARVLEISGSADLDPAAVTGRIVLVAGLAGVLGSVLVSFRQLRKLAANRLLALGASLVALGSLLVAGSSELGVIASAAVAAAFGFGVCNGLEIRVLRGNSPLPENAPTAIATYGALTTLPYVFAGAIGATLLQFNLGVSAIYLVAAFSASMALFIPLVFRSVRT